jgi:hypothetical protein
MTRFKELSLPSRFLILTIGTAFTMFVTLFGGILCVTFFMLFIVHGTEGGILRDLSQIFSAEYFKPLAAVSALTGLLLGVTVTVVHTIARIFKKLRH